MTKDSHARSAHLAPQRSDPDDIAVRMAGRSPAKLSQMFRDCVGVCCFGVLFRESNLHLQLGKRFEESTHSVRWRATTGRDVGQRGQGESLFFEGETGVQVDRSI